MFSFSTLISYIPRRHCSTHPTSETELKRATGAFTRSFVEWHLGFDHRQEGQKFIVYRKHRRGYLSRGGFIKRCAGLRQVFYKTYRAKKQLKEKKRNNKMDQTNKKCERVCVALNNARFSFVD